VVRPITTIRNAGNLPIGTSRAGNRLRMNRKDKFIRLMREPRTVPPLPVTVPEMASPVLFLLELRAHLAVAQPMKPRFRIPVTVSLESTLCPEVIPITVAPTNSLQFRALSRRSPSILEPDL